MARKKLPPQLPRKPLPEIYREVRKNVPPPGKVEEDRRQEIRREIDKRESEREGPRRSGQEG